MYHIGTGIAFVIKHTIASIFQFLDNTDLG